MSNTLLVFTCSDGLFLRTHKNQTKEKHKDIQRQGGFKDE